VIRNSR